MTPEGVWYLGFRTGDGRPVVTKHVDDCPPVPLPVLPGLSIPGADGFDWGNWYAGSAQLALALCADVLGDEHALAVCHKFKTGVVVCFPEAGFAITAEAIEEWARVLDETRRATHLPRDGIILFTDEALPPRPDADDEE